ncbi:MAG: hypothetical protein NTW86_18975 [Candidatus Sumerlaeota bacterium]|nr:hypothetical protein [Candidatus Sumerlaeota bacterium]
MIWTLSIQCVNGPTFDGTFERTIEAQETMTLGELHDTIQRLTGFDHDHLFTFIVGRHWRGRREEIVDTDTTDIPGEALYDVHLNQVFPLPPKMKLFYWFDFGDDWVFQIGRRGKPKPENKRVKYPRVIAKTGRKPRQYSSGW